VSETGPEPRRLPCPRCGTVLEPEQDWCLACGAPARTRLAATPNWRLPIAIVGSILVVAAVALVVAFAALTRDDGQVTAPVPAAPVQPNETPAAAPTAVTTAAPADATPTATTPAPAPVTTPAPADATPAATTPTTRAPVTTVVPASPAITTPTTTAAPTTDTAPAGG
jgi:hypothetical protein